MTEVSAGPSRLAIRLLLEVAVVFLGVYGAFVFDGVRESRARPVAPVVLPPPAPVA